MDAHGPLSLFSSDVVTWQAIVFGTLAVFVAALTQGATGLGFGMVAAPILLILNPIFVPGVSLVLALLVSGLIAIREWQHIDWPGFSVAFSGRVVGTVVAALTIALIPVALFGLIFGLLVLAAVLLSTTGWRAQPSSKNLLTGGFFSGFMGTITAIGAPPIALVYQHQPGAVIRATLAMFFAFGACVSIVALVLVNNFSLLQVAISAIFLPALLAGFWVSSRYAPKFTGRRARYAILLLSASTAMLAVVKSIIAMS